MNKKVRVGSRDSLLAVRQAELVMEAVRKASPETELTLVTMKTTGDRILNQSLDKIGGKGLFVKELETAMQAHEADLAVHSLKDVPMVLPEGFELVAVSKREDPRDAFVSPKYASLDEMPAGARVGTASLRRELMLRINYPHLEVLPVRGNVGTRLKKLDEGQYDALVMASAGLKRLGLAERIREIIPAEKSLPSPGQGALGVEIREDDAVMHEALQFINDPQTRACCFAERAVSRAFGGSCQVPLAAYAVVEDGKLWLRALVGNHHTGECARAEGRGPIEDPEGLALKVVEDLRKQGAETFLQAILGE